MNRILLLSILVILILSGCSSDEPMMVPEEQPSSSENIYLEFNKWVYAQMNRQYLWREDLPDSASCNYDLGPKAFFESLLSDKDRFSYFTSNPYYSEPGERMGFEYQTVRDITGREALMVEYITSRAARRAGLRRGDFVEIVSNDKGKVRLRRFKVEDGRLMPYGDILEITIDDILGPVPSVLLDTIYNIDDRRVGYLCYLEFAEEKELEGPLTRMQKEGITDLILDLRYNPGGYVSTSQFLCNSIVDERAYGDIFQKMSYNDILTQYYMKTSGDKRFLSFYSFPGNSSNMIGANRVVPLDMKRLYVITSGHTASASEATIICLRPYMEVITIGERTVGKGVGSWNIYDTKYPYSIQPITMRYYNASGETVPDSGLEPDVPVEGAYNIPKKDIGDSQEPLLAKALQLIVPGDSVASDENLDPTPEITLTKTDLPSYIKKFRQKHQYERN